MSQNRWAFEMMAQPTSAMSQKENHQMETITVFNTISVVQTVRDSSLSII